MIHKNEAINEIMTINKGTMMETLGIEYLDITEGYVYARMLVKKEISQPYGLLHGGASMAMAESVGGVGTAYLIGMEENEIRGMQMTTNHIHTAKIGSWVYAKANIIHKGKTTHVWNIDILNEDDKIVSTCRLTNFIIKKNLGDNHDKQ